MNMNEETRGNVLGVMVIVLLACFVGVIVSDTNIINGKDNIIWERDSTITNLNSQISSKDSEISSLESHNSYLQTQLDSLNAPRLRMSDPNNTRASIGGTNFGAPVLGWRNENPFLHFWGRVFNVGKLPAYNSKVHVVAKSDDGNTTFLDYYITLGKIEGGYLTEIDTEIDTQIHGETSEWMDGIFHVTFTPEWSVSP